MNKKRQTELRLIEAAMGLFSQHGIERTSLAMIAAEAGISNTSADSVRRAARPDRFPERTSAPCGAGRRQAPASGRHGS